MFAVSIVGSEPTFFDKIDGARAHGWHPELLGGKCYGYAVIAARSSGHHGKFARWANVARTVRVRRKAGRVSVTAR